MPGTAECAGCLPGCQRCTSQAGLGFRRPQWAPFAIGMPAECYPEACRRVPKSASTMVRVPSRGPHRAGCLCQRAAREASGVPRWVRMTLLSSMAEYEPPTRLLERASQTALATTWAISAHTGMQPVPAASSSCSEEENCSGPRSECSTHTVVEAQTEQQTRSGIYLAGQRVSASVQSSGIEFLDN